MKTKPFGPFLVAVVSSLAVVLASPLVAALCDGPDPINPNPRLGAMPERLIAGAPFSFTATAARASCSSPAELVLVFAVRSLDGETALIVPSDARFRATDLEGAPLVAGNHVRDMVLLPAVESIGPSDSSDEIDLALQASAGPNPGEALIYFGAASPGAPFTFTSAGPIPID